MQYYLTAILKLLLIKRYIPVSASKNHAFPICRKFVLCYSRITSLDPQSLIKRRFLLQTCTFMYRRLFSRCWIFSLLPFTLKANNLPSVMKWITLSWNSWDAGDWTEEQSEVSQKDQISAVYVTRCCSGMWAAEILVKACQESWGL